MADAIKGGLTRSVCLQTYNKIFLYKSLQKKLQALSYCARKFYLGSGVGSGRGCRSVVLTKCMVALASDKLQMPAHMIEAFGGKV